ncbi:putative nucleotidyltransferase [Novosphingobium sp. PhB165]|uniref:nucleotidyltransferase domain-containing protein n=1 Tax=Novosphingobium sp. PhB165 TaxID=2485105 RepID=UPI0010431647|nr:nucleotidyltransferase domain-containing protein [Novosphingobium sp. PhB165]TCM19052.1 putative nucleotidyltransferase [Novosphingobium sp. PhB165]
MRMDIDHLPSIQQQELARATQILMEEFSVATSRATQPWKRNGKVQKIILFGSYARGDWVDEPENGYQSDYDLLIIVSHERLTDIAEFWYVAEDKILRDPAIGRQVNIIVHTLDDVNRGLTRGEYFWVDIARDGIALYELAGVALAQPQPLTKADAFEMASKYLAEKLPDIDVWLETAATQLARNDDPLRYRRHAAFNLHQAAETAYICYLLVRSQYVPRSHNLKFLRSLAEDKKPALIEAWPRATKLDRRRFELAKRAYVEARYSSSYEISIEDLQAIRAAVCKLRDTVEAASLQWIESLRPAAERLSRQ